MRNKVDTICTLLRAELERVDDMFYINTILTTYVRMLVPDYESALKLLVQLKGPSLPLSTQKLTAETGKDSARTEEAVRYIIFLSDANKLFDLALGMYDFGLVLMIAQHSQKVCRPSLLAIS